MEMPKIREMRSHSFVLNHYVFHLVMKISVEYYVIIICIFIFIFPLISVIVYKILTSDAVPQNAVINKNNTTIKKNLQLRKLNEKLKMRSNTVLEKKTDKANNVFRSPFESRSRSDSVFHKFSIHKR